MTRETWLWLGKEGKDRMKNDLDKMYREVGELEGPPFRAPFCAFYDTYVKAGVRYQSLRKDTSVAIRHHFGDPSIYKVWGRTQIQDADGQHPTFLWLEEATQHGTQHVKLRCYKARGGVYRYQEVIEKEEEVTYEDVELVAKKHPAELRRGIQGPHVPYYYFQRKPHRGWEGPCEECVDDDDLASKAQYFSDRTGFSWAKYMEEEEKRLADQADGCAPRTCHLKGLLRVCRCGWVFDLRALYTKFQSKGAVIDWLVKEIQLRGIEQEVLAKLDNIEPSSALLFVRPTNDPELSLPGQHRVACVPPPSLVPPHAEDEDEGEPTRVNEDIGGSYLSLKTPPIARTADHTSRTHK